MEDMKGDMAGAAAVVAGIAALAALEVPVRALAVVAAAENMPGSASLRPGDILTAGNGKTIEVTNTDAEGRLVLADALWYTREQGATHVVDFATLTGIMSRALGDVYAGVFANDDGVAGREIEAAGRSSGDYVWPFPLHPRYRRMIDSGVRRHEELEPSRCGRPDLRDVLPRGVRRRGAVGAHRHGGDRVPHLAAGRLPLPGWWNGLGRAADRGASRASRYA